MHGKDCDEESLSPSKLQKRITSQPLVKEGKETVDIVIKEEEVSNSADGPDSTDNVGHLTEHLLTHLQERLHQCELCDKAFATKESLRNHLLSHTGGPYVCGTCGRVFPRKHSLTVHERFHSGEKPFPCGTCEKRFRTSISCYRHRRYWHPSPEDLRGTAEDVCPHCNFEAASSSHLLSHIRILHATYKESPSPLEVKKQIRAKNSAKKGKETVDIIEEEEEDNNEHLLTPSKERRHRCKHCNKAFTSRQNLRTHIRSHTGERPYVCDTCGKGFTSKNYLTVHERFHSGDRRHPCGSCSRRFFSTGDLFRHEMTHIREISKIPNNSEERIQECQFCCKAYVQVEHTNTGPFICATCKKGEETNSEEHERTHSGEEPNTSDNNGRLADRLSTHSGKPLYQCELCDKAFAQKGHLKIHFRSHTGERPYVCDTCGKGFARRSYLIVHERFHSGERPYPCSACDKRYATSGDLQRHMKKVHTRVINSEKPS